MVRAKIVALALFAALPFGQAVAQDGGSEAPRATLWRSLSLGDTPEAVATSLSSMDEIKQATVRPARGNRQPSVSVKYKIGGVAIFGDAYTLAPIFDEGTLKRLDLTALQTCFNSAHQRYLMVADVLRERFPTAVMSEQASEAAFAEAHYKATSLEPVTLTLAMTDGKASAIFQQRFTREDRPNTYYGPGLGRTLSELSIASFERRAELCGGTGAGRVDFIITYMSHDELQERIGNMVEKTEQDRASAKGSL